MLPEKYGPSVQPADLPTTIWFINDIELKQAIMEIAGTSYIGDSSFRAISSWNSLGPIL